MKDSGDARAQGIRSDDIRGHLDALVLACLANGPQHGYAISERLRQVSAFSLDVPTGTLYPALHRLERAGWVESDWSTVAGRRRRTYRLTSSGHRALEHERDHWARLREVVGAFLTPATGQNP